MPTMMDGAGVQSNTAYAAIRMETELKLTTSGFEPLRGYDDLRLLAICQGY